MNGHVVSGIALQPRACRVTYFTLLHAGNSSRFLSSADFFLMKLVIFSNEKVQE